MRGSLNSAASSGKRRGIIPAGAGLTDWEDERNDRVQDHPRGCGAHKSTVPHCTLLTGSSPRVRGSHRHYKRHYALIGIIPAGAGLTTLSNVAMMIGRDHPRGCGAHLIIRGHKGAREGSSPRVRGSLLYPESRLFLSGIIPAGAGLTIALFLLISKRRDHPRGCGAHCSQG